MPVGVTAVFCMLFVVVVFAFPAAPGPNAQTLNYMPIVLGGWLLLSLLFYYLPVVGGKHWFKGPIANIDRVESVDEDIEVRVSDDNEKVRVSDEGDEKMSVGSTGKNEKA